MVVAMVTVVVVVVVTVVVVTVVVVVVVPLRDDAQQPALGRLGLLTKLKRLQLGTPTGLRWRWCSWCGQCVSER